MLLRLEQYMGPPCLYFAVPCCVMLYCAVLCCAVLCCARLCHAVLCCAVTYNGGKCRAYLRQYASPTAYIQKALVLERLSLQRAASAAHQAQVL